jgi:ankyrin repeat protein
MARLLIAHKADAEHINDDGVPPSFHLFQPGPRQSSSTARQLLDVALPYSISNINFQSCEGWTSLHRAAAYGTGDDIDSLVERGADVTMKTLGFEWMPIFVAVHFGNVVAFKRLLHYSGAESIRDTDTRGWTMLHLAAERGDSELVALLIAHGADAHARSELGFTAVPDDLQSHGLTPLDVARASGPEKLQKYVLGLQNAQIDVHIDLEEVFWPVNE